MPLVVLDFDETLVDVDSSEWVAQQFGILPLFDALRRPGRPWHQAFNILLGTLHAEGTGIAQIQQALCRLPLPADTIAAIKASHALGCELLILSDANTFFVETVLHHHGLAPLFSHIYSNPAWIDEDGRLRYGPFHSVVSTDYDAADMMSPPGYDPLPPHNCPLCPPNMCKGSVISAIRAAFCHNDLHDDAVQTSSAAHTNEAAKNDGNGNMATIHDARVIQHIIYGGDGSGDFCPALRLLAEDFILPRQGYPLSEMLFQNAAKVKARVHPWSSLGTTLQKAVEDALSLQSKGKEPSSKNAPFSPQSAQVKLGGFKGYGDQMKVLSCQGFANKFNGPVAKATLDQRRGHPGTPLKYLCNQAIASIVL